MQHFELFRSSLFIGYRELVIFVVIEFPGLLEEAEYAFNTVGIPGFVCFQWSEEHFIETQCVGAVMFYQLIRVLNIVFRLGHFFHFPATDIFFVFEDELRIFILLTPVFECLCVENVVVNKVDIHMKSRGFVIFSQSF